MTVKTRSLTPVPGCSSEIHHSRIEHILSMICTTAAEQTMAQLPSRVGPAQKQGKYNPPFQMGDVDQALQNDGVGGRQLTVPQAHMTRQGTR